eukprot:4683853-Prymnesium_polylepis.1
MAEAEQSDSAMMPALIDNLLSAPLDDRNSHLHLLPLDAPSLASLSSCCRGLREGLEALLRKAERASELLLSERLGLPLDAF